MEGRTPDTHRSGPARVLTGLVIAASVVFGATMILLAFTLGGCSAFGGRCPREVPPVLDDDVFGMAAMGAALMVGVPVFVTRPSWRRLGAALAAAATAAVLVGLAARNAA